jgi:hypothetical protein
MHKDTHQCANTTTLLSLFYNCSITVLSLYHHFTITLYYHTLLSHFTITVCVCSQVIITGTLYYHTLLSHFTTTPTRTHTWLLSSGDSHGYAGHLHRPTTAGQARGQQHGGQRFAVCCLLSSVCCLLSAVCCLRFAVCCLLSACKCGFRC